MTNFEKLAIASLLEGKLKVNDLDIKDFTGKSPRFLFNLIKKYSDTYGRIPAINSIEATINTQISEDKAKVYVGYLMGLPENIQDDSDYILGGLRTSNNIKILDSKIESLVELVSERDLDGAREVLKELLETTNDSKNKVADMKDLEFSTDNLLMLDCVIPDVSNKLQGVTLISAKSGCVDKDTEYLTRGGWKKFNEYTEDDEVLQWFPDNSTEFVKPIRYIKQQAGKMYHFKSRTVDMVLSSDHRVPYIVKDKLYVTTAEEVVGRKLRAHFNVGIPTKFYTPNNVGSGLELTDAQIRVMVAVIADGSFAKTSVNSNWCRFNLKKEHKKERLEKLLCDANIPFNKIKSVATFCNTFYFHTPIQVKDFKSFWGANKSQLEVIVDEVTHWDGAIVTSTDSSSPEFYSCSKESIDFIQYAFSTVRGKVASVKVDNRVGRTYHTGGKDYIRKSVSYSTRGTSFVASSLAGCVITDFVPEDGLEYCFEVPSTFFLARRNGKIFVTGNCGKSVLAMQQALYSYKQGYNVLYLNLELSQNEAIARVLSSELHIPFQDIYRDLGADEVEYYNDKKEELFSKPNKFKMLNSGVDATKIINLIRAEKETGIDLVVIDYLQIVENKDYEEQWRFLSQFVKDLHRLTLELGICILTPIQINEVTEKNGNVNVTARGSQELMFTSSLWFHLHQSEDEAKEGLARMFTIKSRHSRKNTYVLQPDFEHMRFNATGLTL